jgi:hypothetical protein
VNRLLRTELFIHILRENAMIKLKPPHILRASTNVSEMLENLRHILDANACSTIQGEINNNVKSLFLLGEEHFHFARQTQRRFWRQRISRLYYGAYNIRRAVQLLCNGTYRTDVSDHSKIGELIDSFPNKDTYKRKLTDLREDRNLADYSHDANESDLILSQDDAEALITEFINDARNFLNNRGVNV